MAKLSEYDLQAKMFLLKTDTKMEITFDHYGVYFNDGVDRNIYKVKLRRNGKTFTFTFGDSVVNTQKNEKPSQYDILSCLTKYEPEDNIDDFANEFGYDLETSYRSTEKIWRSVQREYEKIYDMFSDVMEELREIQ